MADTKITALAAITTVDPAADVLPIVDISDTSMAASGTTKKITSNQILGAGGTATLASATITGDLTVDTNTLFVDSANDAVLIGSVTKALYGGNKLEVRGASISDANLGVTNTGNLAIFTTDSQAIDTGGVLSLGGGFNGTTPYMFAGMAGRKETASNGIAQGYLQLFTTNVSNAITERYRITGDGVHTWQNVGGVAGTAMTLNSTGLGVGVTPSAWGGGGRAFEIGFIGTGIQSRNNQYATWTQNAWYNSSAQWVYGASGLASRYDQDAGTHKWFIAPSGTGGLSIGFTQAMTLDASGNLLVGTTGNGTSARTIISQASGSLPALYLSGGAGSTPLINFNGSGRVRSDGSYLTIETTNASGIIYMTANTNGVYLAVGGTSWTANSDERLKDIIEPIGNAVAKVGSLRSVIGKFKTDSEGTRRTFLIAQDVQKVLPEAVDASNPDRLGVGYSEVIPLLVAAIKELTARVQTLEAK